MSDCVSQQDLGSDISPTLRFEWITAQWAWSKTSKKTGEPTRLRVTVTFMLPEEIGTRQKPHKITFNLTDRLREFKPANLFQQQIKTVIGVRGDRWIGKARIRQPRNEPVAEQHRRNIPDVVMSAWHDETRNIICARLFTPQQQIDLEFDQALSEKQRQIYDGAASWGRLPKKNRPRDDFYDWIRYA